MISERPDPDELLCRVKAAEEQAGRGRLKIFFGYAAGVGKTYAMLQAARREKAAGIDVVVGYVEPHGRKETEALLEGLEALPFRMMPYRDVVLREFDLDAALARRPQLILVDELAHTNAEGLRHSKRWQDVAELLAAGIDVYTSLNVQHIESLNDVIAKITGVIVRETLPDKVLEQADEFELIDLTPEELIERLQAGKIYLPQQAERALRNFFQKGNLLALRELSLRQTAQRLQQDVEAARRTQSVRSPWATQERLLVCVGPSPTTARLLRTAKRMAAGLQAEWLAVAVETGKGAANLSARQRVAEHLRLAEQLGAEPHTLVGKNVAEEILNYARSRNVTKIVVGKTAVAWWRRLIRATVVDQLLEQSDDIDIYVIRGEGDVVRPAPSTQQARGAIDWKPYQHTAGIVIGCGLIAWMLHWLGLAEANLAMVFLLGVVLAAYRFGRGPAIAASVANVLVFDFFFVPPQFTFAVSDVEYIITFGVMLAIGIIISALTSRLRGQLSIAQRSAQRTAALLRLTRQMSEVSGSEFLIRLAARQLSEIFDGAVLFYTLEPDNTITLRYGRDAAIANDKINELTAAWVAQHDQAAGMGTDTLPNATALFVPLIGSQRNLGAIGVRSKDQERLQDPEQRHLLESCASLIALSLERDQSVIDAQQAQLRIEAEELRNSLLSSVSHDLRTPLASIAGASTGLLNDSASDFDPSQRELLQTIVEESRRLSRLVDNLLDMTRLESGTVKPNKQWHVLEEIVGSAITTLRRELAKHPVKVSLPENLPLVSVDSVLLEQVLINLLENAVRYTPPETQIDISAQVRGRELQILVQDHGPGFPQGTEAKVFEKFFRAAAVTADGRRGVGLGLTICQAIMHAHQGTITAHNRHGGGAEFRLTLPLGDAPPPIPAELEHSTLETAP